jgi:thymidylate synthase (FAD)
MRAIKPYATILDIDIGVDVLKKIEWVGRTCYKSTDAITDESAPKFVAGLIKRGHEAMLEHASFCFEIDYGVYCFMKDVIQYLPDEYDFKSFMRFTKEDRVLMSGNVRAWRDLFESVDCWFGIPDCFEGFIKENPVLFPEYQDKIFRSCNIGSIHPVSVTDLKSEEEFLTHCDVTVGFVVDRGISHELVRHRPASFAQESTRYCNYAQDKFGGQITFIIPEFFQYGSPEWKIWKENMTRSEADYLKLIELGVSPEKARGVLGTSLKTEVIMTANCAEWKHFFELRACNKTGKAHPQMLEVAQPLLDDFKRSITVIFDDLSYEGKKGSE